MNVTRLSRLRLVVVALGLALIGGSLAGSPAVSPAHAESSSGLTDSAVTVTAREQDPWLDSAPFPDLELTVGQTKDLINQGISITWKGGKKSTRTNDFNPGANYLQIFQCWEEDPARPGHPDKETCQFGGNLTHRQGSRYSDTSKTLTGPLDPLEPSKNVITSGSDYDKFNILVPFRSVTGKTIGQLIDGASKHPDGTPFHPLSLYANEFFTEATSNEVSWAGTGGSGYGELNFEVQTGLEAPGLGCGEDLAGSPRPCWLVAVPRGLPNEEAGYEHTSGLLESVWRHHVAVKLDFQPRALRCTAGAAELTVAGSELGADAVRSWQPQLCSGGTHRIYNYSLTAESDAVSRVANTGTGLALTSRPLDTEQAGLFEDPLDYAPVLLSGASIAFAVDQDPKRDLPEAETQNEGLPLTELRLTPRLVAKLLTSSYTRAVPQNWGLGQVNTDISHLGKNPAYLQADPEFSSINGGAWSLQHPNYSLASMLTPLGRSDIAHQLWAYVLADTDAREWLAGEADPWGMKVNPWYASSARVNLADEPLEYPREDFPKADPISSVGSVDYGPIDLVTFKPYTNSFTDASRFVLRGNTMTAGKWDQVSIPKKWRLVEPGRPGDRAVLGVTTTPAAGRYQVLQAKLRNPAGEFVAPTDESLAAAAAVMSPTGDAGTLGLDFGSPAVKDAKGAYPLAMPLYAAANVTTEDATARADYAAFIRYAVGAGQKQGAAAGDLPPGYAPVPEQWRARSLATADAIEQGGWPERPQAEEPTDQGGAAGGSGGQAPTGSTSSTQSGAGDQAAPPSSSGGPPAPTPTGPVGSQAAPVGVPTGSLVGAATPADPAPLSVAVPAGLAAGLGLLGVSPFIGRRRGRAAAAAGGVR